MPSTRHPRRTGHKDPATLAACAPDPPAGAVTHATGPTVTPITVDEMDPAVTAGLIAAGIDPADIHFPVSHWDDYTGRFIPSHVFTHVPPFDCVLVFGSFAGGNYWYCASCEAEGPATGIRIDGPNEGHAYQWHVSL